MLNLKSLSDETLLKETQRLVREEREILGRILHHLKEIERRRLFSTLKYASLFEYATKELGYSEDQAYRRIQAMRIIKELPEIEIKINEGKLNLTHLGLAQSLFKREEKLGEKISKVEKIEILDKLQNTSKREAEKITQSFSSEETVMASEKIRSISEENIEIKFVAKEDLLKKINKLKGLLAHKNPHLQLSELIDQLCDLGLEKWDKSTNSAPARVKIKSQSSCSVNPTKAQVKRQVWQRDHGKCQVCSSQYALEIDHIKPKALGGEDTLENLRLLCRTCNQRAAVKVFGLSKMEKYINT